MNTKTSRMLWMVVTLLVAILPAQDYVNGFPVLKGPYLGQTPPGMTPEIFAPGIVSTKAAEFANTFSTDGQEFYFSRMAMNLGHIMVVKQKNGIWKEPQIVSFSAGCLEFDQTFSPDGSKLFFCSNRPVAGKGDKSANHHDIWVVERIKDGWSRPKNIGFPVNTVADEFYPSVTRDGAIYFCSGRPGGYGHNDFYRARWFNGTYTTPENLGPVINTGHREGDGFIAPDESYFIWSAFVFPDKGNADLFISYRKNDGSWSKPLNLGEPINSKTCELTPWISHDGRYLFFGSNRTGNYDIYWVSAGFIENLETAE